MQANPIFKIDAVTLHALCQRIAEKAYEEGYEQRHAGKMRDLKQVELNYATILKAEFSAKKSNASRGPRAAPSKPTYRPPKYRGTRR